MAHLFINHHFFFDSISLSEVFKGPSKDLVRTQIRSLKSYCSPAKNIWENLSLNGNMVFSLTVDDGSSSINSVIPIFQEENVHVSLCICGIPLAGKVLLSHKINLLRSELDDAEMWSRLCQAFGTDFNLADWPLKGGVKQESLYRYDEPSTRIVKTALNYQLSYAQTSQFIEALFSSIMGSESEVCRLLYLDEDDLDKVSQLPNVDIMFHGNEHRLWSELNEQEHYQELSPPTILKNRLSEKYILSIPYGMEGSYDPDRVVKDAGPAVGAFTMGRNLHHQMERNHFYWLNRFDQVDIFERNGTVKTAILKELSAQRH